MKFDQLDEFATLVSIGLISNVIVGAASLYGSNYLLFGITLFIFILSLIGYGIYHYTEYNEFGYHVMMGSYLIGFTYAISTKLIIYPLILVFPILIGLSSVLFTRRLSKLLYFIFCMGGTLYYILMHQQHFSLIETNVDMFNSIAIASGMTIGLYYVAYIHESTLDQYQKKVEENEKSLSEKNDELEKYIDSNLQLENFAYLASHELKTPMRNISNFAGLLGVKLKDKMTPDETELIGFVNSEVIRMNSLIADLLKLSQMSNEEISYETIETKAFIDEIISDKFLAYKANIKIGMLPYTINGSKELIRQLFQNIIQNAIKFKSQEKELRMRISGRNHNNFAEIEICDNGIGIKDEFKDQIFLIFKRLRDKSDIQGNGIGLALCKKIVERHGGKIWVKDRDSGGSVFTFTLQTANKKLSA